jgi:hypothetical protein
VIIVSKDLSLKDQIIQKAWEDAAFKQELLASPKAALKQSFDMEFPEDLEINAVSETSRKFFFVIPPKPSEYKENQFIPIPSAKVPMWE